MIERIRVSLWDVLVYFLSGTLLLFSVLIHLAGLGRVRFEDVALLEKMPGPILLLVAVVGLPLLGMLLEPVANLADDAVHRLTRSFARRTGRHVKADSRIADLHERLGGLVQRQYMPAAVAAVIEPYQWCKDYVVQLDRPTPYMTFLAKFGFYRSAAFVVSANAIALPLAHGGRSATFLGAAALLLLAAFLRVRSIRFYAHLTQAIYHHYLVAVTTEPHNEALHRPAGSAGRQ